MSEPIGAAIIVYDKHTNTVLLGKRQNAYKAGFMGMPGGRVEPQEKLLDCAKRELAEETSLKAKNIKYLGAVKEWQVDKHFIHFVYLCDDFTGQPRVCEKDKCKAWGWFSLTNLPEKILKGHELAIKLWREKLSLVEA